MKFSLNDRFNNSKKSARSRVWNSQISGGSTGEFYRAKLSGHDSVFKDLPLQTRFISYK